MKKNLMENKRRASKIARGVEEDSKHADEPKSAKTVWEKKMN